jgi:hypothetical protein
MVVLGCFNSLALEIQGCKPLSGGRVSGKSSVAHFGPAVFAGYITLDC